MDTEFITMYVLLCALPLLVLWGGLTGLVILLVWWSDVRKQFRSETENSVARPLEHAVGGR